MIKSNARSGNMTTVQKVSGGARIADAVLSLVFLALAINSGWWFWWASAGLCAFTAITGPLDKLAKFVGSKFLRTKSAR